MTLVEFPSDLNFSFSNVEENSIVAASKSCASTVVVKV